MKFEIKESFRKALSLEDRGSKRFKFVIQLILCLGILIFGIITFILLSSISQKPQQKSPESLIKTLIAVPVNIRNYRYEFTGYGTVKPSVEISVSSEVTGQIVYESPALEEGNFVQKGTVLLKIDDIDYRLALKEAETEALSLGLKIKMTSQDIVDGKDLLETRAKALELDEIDLKRREQLNKKGAISNRALEEAKRKVSDARHQLIQERNLIAKYELELESLKADLAKAKVKRQQADKNLRKTVIKAPINGRLEDISISEEEYVSPGAFLFEINDRRNLSIDVPIEIEDALYLMDFVNQAKESAVDTGDWFRIIKNTAVRIYWTGDFKLCKWSGKIVRVKKFDAETRTLTLKVDPVKYIGSNKETVPLVEGMFCKMDFVGKEIKNSVKIPWAALQLNGGVYVVGKDSIVNEIFPKILNSNNNEIIISAKGLKEGEHIISQRIPESVVNGTKVNILKASPEKLIKSK